MWVSALYSLLHCTHIYNILLSISSLSISRAVQPFSRIDQMVNHWPSNPCLEHADHNMFWWTNINLIHKEGNVYWMIEYDALLVFMLSMVFYLYYCVCQKARVVRRHLSSFLLTYAAFNKRVDSFLALSRLYLYKNGFPADSLSTLCHQRYSFFHRCHSKTRSPCLSHWLWRVSNNSWWTSSCSSIAWCAQGRCIYYRHRFQLCKR